MSGFSKNLTAPGTYPQTYAQAREMLGDRQQRKLGHETYLHAGFPGRVIVRLHETGVVTFWQDGTATLHSGGWQTKTTRSRMRACGFDVFTGYGVAGLRLKGGRTVVYLDGVTVSRDRRSAKGHGGRLDAVERLRKARLRAGLSEPMSRHAQRIRLGNVPEANPAERPALAAELAGGVALSRANRRRGREAARVAWRERPLPHWAGPIRGADFRLEIEGASGPTAAADAFLRYGCVREPMRVWYRDLAGIVAHNAPDPDNAEAQRAYRDFLAAARDEFARLIDDQERARAELADSQGAPLATVGLSP